MKGLCTNKIILIKTLCEQYNFSDSTTGDICPVGHYCPNGTSSPKTCPDKTYMEDQGASVCLTCPLGFYCTGGASAHPCPQGYYCPTGTGSGGNIACPIGKWNMKLKLVSRKWKFFHLRWNYICHIKFAVLNLVFWQTYNGLLLSISVHVMLLLKMLKGISVIFLLNIFVLIKETPQLVHIFSVFHFSVMKVLSTKKKKGWWWAYLVL